MALDPVKIYDKDNNDDLVLANVLLPAVYNSEGYRSFYNKYYRSTGNTSPRDIQSITEDVVNIYGFNKESTQGIKSILQTLPSYFFASDFINNVDLRPLFKAYEGKYIIGEYKSSENRNDKDYKPKQIDSGTFVDKITEQFKKTYDAELDGSSEAKLKNPSGWSPSAKIINGGQEPSSPTGTPATPLDNGDVPQVDDNFLYNYKQYLDIHYEATVKDLLQIQESGNAMLPSMDTQSFNKSDFDALTGIVTAKKTYTGPYAAQQEYQDSRIAAEGGGAVRWNLAKAISYPSMLDSKQLRDLQQTLKMNGYFQNQNNQQPTLGVMDDLTNIAWNKFLTASIRSELSPAEFAKKNQAELKAKLDAGLEVATYSATLLESMADKFGLDYLGRKLNGNETASLGQAIRQWNIQNNKDVVYNNLTDGSIVDDNVYSYLTEEFKSETNFNNMADMENSMKEVFK
jgi:hypothetical protein